MQPAQEGIIQQENKRAKTQTYERNILAELEVLDKKLVSQQEKIDALEQRSMTSKMIDQKENDLRKIRDGKKTCRKSPAKTNHRLLHHGRYWPFECDFLHQNTAGTAHFHDAFDTLIKYDQEVIKAYRRHHRPTCPGDNSARSGKIDIKGFH